MMIARPSEATAGLHDLRARRVLPLMLTASQAVAARSSRPRRHTSSMRPMVFAGAVCRKKSQVRGAASDRVARINHNEGRRQCMRCS